MTAAEKIAALRATHEAASPGEWRVTLAAPCFLQVSQVGGWTVAHTGDEMQRYSSEDAHAIVSAHNALPALLKALEDVLDIERVPVNRGQVQTYDEGWLDGYNDARREFHAAIEAALAEVQP